MKEGGGGQRCNQSLYALFIVSNCVQFSAPYLECVSHRVISQSTCRLKWPKNGTPPRPVGQTRVYGSRRGHVFSRKRRVRALGVADGPAVHDDRPAADVVAFPRPADFLCEAEQLARGVWDPVVRPRRVPVVIHPPGGFQRLRGKTTHRLDPGRAGSEI